jgi:6-phosphogluconate dehydrogenase
MTSRHPKSTGGTLTWDRLRSCGAVAASSALACATFSLTQVSISFCYVLISFPLSRLVFLGDIKKAFDKNSKLTNLLLDDFFKTKIEQTQAG